MHNVQLNFTTYAKYCTQLYKGFSFEFWIKQHSTGLRSTLEITLGFNWPQQFPPAHPTWPRALKPGPDWWPGTRPSCRSKDKGGAWAVLYGHIYLWWWARINWRRVRLGGHTRRTYQEKMLRFCMSKALSKQQNWIISGESLYQDQQCRLRTMGCTPCHGDRLGWIGLSRSGHGLNSTRTASLSCCLHTNIHILLTPHTHTHTHACVHIHMHIILCTWYHALPSPPAGRLKGGGLERRSLDCTMCT